MKINRGNLESNKLFLKKSNLLNNDKKILEIGSGNGVMVDYLSKEGFCITGTEINDEFISFAKKQYNVDLKKMGGSRLDFPDNSFDIVLSFDVFEHIPDTDRHLQEVKRILKPSGYYLFVTPNRWTNIPFEIIKEKSLTKWQKYHCSLHDYWQIQKRLRKHGLSMKFIKIPLVNDYFLEKIKKYLGNIGLYAIKIVNPDKLPFCLQTNFFVIAQK